MIQIFTAIFTVQEDEVQSCGRGQQNDNNIANNNSRIQKNNP